MTRLTVLALAAVLGLVACGSGEGPEAAPKAESEPSALPDVARIVCKPDGPPLVETPAVKPLADGVHLEIVNETGADLSLALPTMGTGAPAGRSMQIVDLGPGELTVTCAAPETLDPDDVFERAGYPAAEGARVRLIRNGEPLAVVFLMDDGAGKWLVGGVNCCSSLAD